MSDWHRQETYKGMIALSIEVVRSLLLVNGGAAVALLAFWGNARSDASLHLSSPLMCFVAGLVCALLAIVLAYVTQNALYREERDAVPIGKRWHGYILVLALICCFLSVAAFGVGAIWAADAMS